MEWLTKQWSGGFSSKQRVLKWRFLWECHLVLHRQDWAEWSFGTNPLLSKLQKLKYQKKRTPLADWTCYDVFEDISPSLVSASGIWNAQTLISCSYWCLSHVTHPDIPDIYIPYLHCVCSLKFLVNGSHLKANHREGHACKISSTLDNRQG